MPRAFLLSEGSRLRAFARHVSFGEVSGALGDLGTFLPIVVGLTQTVGLDLGTTLWFTGAYNIATGLLYDVPIPVQPMKTIAAVALSGNGLTLPEIMAAGIFVSGAVLVLGATGLMGVANRLTPAAVIRGMQLGVGLQLASSGFSKIWYQTDAVSGKTLTSMNSVFGVNGIFVGMFFIVFILLGVYNINSGRVGGCLSGGACGGLATNEASTEAASSTEPSSPAKTDSIKCSETEPDREPTARAADSSHEHDCNHDVEAAVPRTSLATAPSRAMNTMRDVLEAKVLKYVYMAGDKACQAVGEATDTEHLAKTKKHTAKSSTLPQHNRRNIPAALIIVIIGVILVFAFDPSIVSTLSMGPSTPQVIMPNATEWKTGILRAGLPQLPLTTLNSIISVTHLSNEWFPDRYMRPGSIATSVGLMNLVGCWFGAFPSCHGAGGLAAQVRFGARWGTAPVLLGLFKVVISLLFGSSLVGIFQAFSKSILGAMLVFSGIELATVAQGQRGERGMCVMLLVAAIGLSTKNIAIGVLVGLVCAYILAIWDFVLGALSTWWVKKFKSSRVVTLE